MRRRTVVISTCVMLCAATPALPQPLLNAAPIVSRQDSYTTPPNMRAALRAWGLARPSANLRFTKRSVTQDRAEFDAIVSTNATGQTATLENLVITRNAVPGPGFGQFTLQARKLVTSRGDQVGTLSIVGLRGGANLATLVSTTFDGAAVTNPARTAFGAAAESLTLANLSSSPTASEGNARQSIDEIMITRPKFGDGTGSFEGLSVTNLLSTSSLMDLKVGSVRLTDAGPVVGGLLGRFLSGNQGPLDIKTLTFGSLNFSDVALNYKSLGHVTSPISTISVASLQVAGAKQGLIDIFELAALKVDGTVGRRPWQSSLRQLTMGGINTNYLSEVGGYITAISKSIVGRRSPESAAPIAMPRRTLAEVLPGGPLDGGFARFDLTDLRASAGVMEFELDQLGLRQQKNEAGIVTNLDFVPSRMRFSWSAIDSGSPSSMNLLLGNFDEREIVIRFSATSSFSPATDIFTLNTYRVEMENWGRVDMGFTMSGLNAFMTNTSLSDMTNLTTPPPPCPPTIPPNELAALIALYRDVSINSGQMELTDTGGMEKAVRMSTAMRERRRSGTAVNLTPSQVQETRLRWALTPRTTSGDKTKPALERQFGIGMARWIENGGTIKFAMTPPQPLAVSEFSQPQRLTPERLGLRITNQAPPAR